MKKVAAVTSLERVVRETFPVLSFRKEWGQWRYLGVAIDDLPLAGFELGPVGSRGVVGVDLQMRILGLASEESPVFRDPPGQPETLVKTRPIVRTDDTNFEWNVDPKEYSATLREAAIARYRSWQADLITAVDHNHVSWARNAETLQQLNQPWALLYKYGDAPTDGFSFADIPSASTFARMPVYLLFALLGVAPVLDRILPTNGSADAIERLRNVGHALARVKSVG